MIEIILTSLAVFILFSIYFSKSFWFHKKYKNKKTLKPNYKATIQVKKKT